MQITLDQAIDTVMQLPVTEQEMLVEIVRGRTIAERRREIAEDAKVSLAKFRTGHIQPQTAEQIIAELDAEEDQEDR